MTQRGLDVGVLVAWTKSFNCPGVVGQDAVKMLNDAVKRVGHLPVKVVSSVFLQYYDYAAANKIVSSPILHMSHRITFQRLAMTKFWSLKVKFTMAKQVFNI
jgi:hypothetical protein